LGLGLVLRDVTQIKKPKGKKKRKKKSKKKNEKKS
jgi:hypothetical protein